MVLERELFRQAEFIDTAVDNVAIALRDGAILVVVIIFLFLVNFRATAISAIALPISLVVAVIALEWLDAGINTMTLGGLTIAIGALVDDAIIDVENVVRRLRENAARPEAERRPSPEVIYEASREIRGSIVFAMRALGGGPLSTAGHGGTTTGPPPRARRSAAEAAPDRRRAVARRGSGR
jgi:Cu/Ag efflux pump CusA